MVIFEAKEGGKMLYSSLKMYQFYIDKAVNICTVE